MVLEALEGDVRSDRLLHLPLHAAQETEEKSSEVQTYTGAVQDNAVCQSSNQSHL